MGSDKIDRRLETGGMMGFGGMGLNTSLSKTPVHESIISNSQFDKEVAVCDELSQAKEIKELAAAQLHGGNDQNKRNEYLLDFKTETDS
mmetsp:Transcript_5427/g.7252  ORF Transcript_5427/g.7252 Transcript_5427/m.7252 type:complete len:89 (-) Transcript_5427:1945-2211(-)